MSRAVNWAPVDVAIALEGSVEILEFVAREGHALTWIATLPAALNPRLIPPS